MVGWKDSGRLGVQCGLVGSGRVRVCRLLLRLHTGVDGEVVVGGEWMLRLLRADVILEAFYDIN